MTGSVHGEEGLGDDMRLNDLAKIRLFAFGVKQETPRDHWL